VISFHRSFSSSRTRSERKFDLRSGTKFGGAVAYVMFVIGDGLEFGDNAVELFNFAFRLSRDFDGLGFHRHVGCISVWSTFEFLDDRSIHKKFVQFVIR
jgi:hypothetical protein